MMLKREATESQPPAPSAWRKWMRAGSAAVAAALTAVTLAAGCLDRPVTPQDPGTSNIYVAEIRQTAVDKIDLLFMIDNSISMADKQEILRQAVPVLVQRLVTPRCLGANDVPTGQNVGANGTCNQGQPEFSPIKDIHIAIVTSSLGAHGGQVCDPAQGGDASENDKGYPIGRVRPGLASWADTGFLAWDPDAATPGRERNNPPGVSVAGTLIDQFQDMVAATGEIGCGFEASLEAWYRFLIDPDPPSNVYAEVDGNGNPVNTVADFRTLDATILDLRARFLRPDSLVAIIMLTDENDCSIRDQGQSWLVGLRTYQGGQFRMPKSTSICATDPNSACCTSCAIGTPPAGCQADPECASPNLTLVDDALNLRCYNQKQRFGFDLLQPLQRYIDGLTQPTLQRDPRAVEAEKATNPNAPTVKQNPLFAGGQRDRSLIFLAGIVGVPWQDVSTEASWAPGAPLEYLKYEDLKAMGRLEWMLGPAAGGFPLDGLMYETPRDRTTMANEGLPQTHPGTGAALAPSGPGPATNPINGKESRIDDKSDLQFACIFDLPEAARRDKMNCTNMQSSCDCRPVDDMYSRALCEGHNQIKAKAYPGTRHLQVLRGFGDLTQNAIIASICPKISDSAQMGSQSYGYTPAVSAIIERLKEALRGKCLPRPLTACDCDPMTEDCTDRIPCQAGAVRGQVSCSVIEAKLPEQAGVCAPCDNNPQRLGRRAPKDEIRPAVERQLQDQGHCGALPLPACNQFCLCEIEQFTGDSLRQCQESVTTPTNIYGYCYIDPEAAPTDAAEDAARQIVANCPQTQQRLLRFAGDDVPTKGAIALIACLGANVQSSGN